MQMTAVFAQPQQISSLLNEYEEVTHGLDEQILVHVGLDTAGFGFAFVPEDLREACYTQSVKNEADWVQGSCDQRKTVASV
jgi:hypothetical protein